MYREGKAHRFQGVDTEREINAAFGEILATQAVLTRVLRELKAIDPRFGAAFARAFDHAANGIEDLAIASGKSVPPEHLVKAVKIVEDLRRAVFGNPKKPTGII